jgi:hypothetical protein
MIEVAGADSGADADKGAHLVGDGEGAAERDNEGAGDGNGADEDVVAGAGDGGDEAAGD